MAEAQEPTNVVKSDVTTDANTGREAQMTAEEANLHRLCKDMFEKASDYLRGEFEGTIDEYKLLEDMNKATINKYAEMKDISTNINIAMKNLDDKYASLQPYLEMIDQVEENVSKLEQAAYKLDAYSKRLEAKFKQLERR